MDETATAAVASAEAAVRHAAAADTKVVAEKVATPAAAASEPTPAHPAATEAAAPALTPAEIAEAAEAAEAHHQATHKVTLEDYCKTLSAQKRGNIEMISAFHAVETAGHHLMDTTPNFDAAFAALQKQKA